VTIAGAGDTLVGFIATVDALKHVVRGYRWSLSPGNLLPDQMHLMGEPITNSASGCGAPVQIRGAISGKTLILQPWRGGGSHCLIYHPDQANLYDAYRISILHS
jgi:hypothetical protein